MYENMVKFTQTYVCDLMSRLEMSRYLGTKEGVDRELFEDISAWLDDDLIARSEPKPSQSRGAGKRNMRREMGSITKDRIILSPSQTKSDIVELAVKLRLLELRSEFRLAKERAVRERKYISKNKALALRYLKRKQAIINSLLY